MGMGMTGRTRHDISVLLNVVDEMVLDDALRSFGGLSPDYFYEKEGFRLRLFV
jgi:hypothetical protein